MSDTNSKHEIFPNFSRHPEPNCITLKFFGVEAQNLRGQTRLMLAHLMRQDVPKSALQGGICRPSTRAVIVGRSNAARATICAAQLGERWRRGRAGPFPVNNGPALLSFAVCCRDFYHPPPYASGQLFLPGTRARLAMLALREDFLCHRRRGRPAAREQPSTSPHQAGVSPPQLCLVSPGATGTRRRGMNRICEFKAHLS